MMTFVGPCEKWIFTWITHGEWFFHTNVNYYKKLCHKLPLSVHLFVNFDSGGDAGEERDT